MTDKVNAVVFTGFNNVGQVLKAVSDIPSTERFFEGVLSAQVIDKQGEVTITDELLKVLPIWMASGAPISDTHSNRIVGQGINFAKTTIKTSEGKEVPAIKIIGKIHNRGYELDDAIWNAIKSGEYKGLSFGGATRSGRVPIKIDGKMAYALKDLEQYEVAVCRDPAVPLAIITEFNALAKAMPEESKTVNKTDLANGQVKLHCDNVACYVEKAVQPETQNTIKNEQNTVILNSEVNNKNHVMVDASNGIKKEDMKEEKDEKKEEESKHEEAQKSAIEVLMAKQQKKAEETQKAYDARLSKLEQSVETIAKSTLEILERMDSKKGLDAEVDLPATNGSKVKIPNKPYVGQSNQAVPGASEAVSDSGDKDNTGSDVIGKAAPRTVSKAESPRVGVVDAPEAVVKSANVSSKKTGRTTGSPVLDEVRKSGDLSAMAAKILYDAEFVNGTIRAKPSNGGQ